MPITGDQPAILPSAIVTGPAVGRRPADRAEEDHVGGAALRLGALGPVARAVLEVVLSAARDLVDLERDAERARDLRRGRARFADDLDPDAVSR